MEKLEKIPSLLGPYDAYQESMLGWLDKQLGRIFKANNIQKTTDMILIWARSDGVREMYVAEIFNRMPGGKSDWRINTEGNFIYDKINAKNITFDSMVGIFQFLKENESSLVSTHAAVVFREPGRDSVYFLDLDSNEMITELILKES